MDKEIQKIVQTNTKDQLRKGIELMCNYIIEESQKKNKNELCATFEKLWYALFPLKL